MSAIDELKALEANATAAPWKVAGICAECTCGKPETHGSIQVTDARGISRNVVDGFRCANASNDVQLIALLRNRAADLIALAEAVRTWRDAQTAERIARARWGTGSAAADDAALKTLGAEMAVHRALARVDNNGEGER
jgi:hypothetical protein